MSDKPQEYPLWLVDLVSFLVELRDVDFAPSMVQHRVDGLLYTSSKWPASIGIALWPKLGVLFGPLLRNITSGTLGEMEAADAALEVATRANEMGLAPLARTVLGRVQVDILGGDPAGGSVITGFDKHFSGEYLHLLKVCALAIGHNLRGPTLGSHSWSGSPNPAEPAE